MVENYCDRHLEREGLLSYRVDEGLEADVLEERLRDGDDNRGIVVYRCFQHSLRALKVGSVEHTHCILAPLSILQQFGHGNEHVGSSSYSSRDSGGDAGE